MICAYMSTQIHEDGQIALGTFHDFSLFTTFS